MPAHRPPCSPRSVGLRAVAHKSTFVTALAVLTACQATLPSSAPDFAAIVDRAAPAVVGIGDAQQMLGSGFRLQSTDSIITAAHIVAAAHGNLRVRWQSHDYAATVLQSDEKTDLAVLRLTESAPMPGLAIVARGTRIRAGQWIIILGCPFGAAATATAGIISAPIGAIEAPESLRERLQLNAALNPGNSGGPVIALDGHVVAIATASIPGAYGLGFATPADALAGMTAVAGGVR
jgi:serine protease Do